MATATRSAGDGTVLFIANSRAPRCGAYVLPYVESVIEGSFPSGGATPVPASSSLSSTQLFRLTHTIATLYTDKTVHQPRRRHTAELSAGFRKSDVEWIK